MDILKDPKNKKGGGKGPDMVGNAGVESGLSQREKFDNVTTPFQEGNGRPVRRRSKAGRFTVEC